MSGVRVVICGIALVVRCWLRVSSRVCGVALVAQICVFETHGQQGWAKEREILEQKREAALGAVLFHYFK